MVTARRFRLATVVLLALCAVLVPVEPAAAFSCVDEDPRESLARADAAFIGELVSTRSLPPEYPLWQREILTFRVHEVVKGNLGELVEVRNSTPGYSPRAGSETGVFLYASEGGFGTSACDYISPKHLRVAQRGGPAVKKASDPRAKVSFRLKGRRLRVSVARNAPRRVKRALRRRVKLVCGNSIYGDRAGTRGRPLATATARFRRGARKMTVLLNRDVSRTAIACTVERVPRSRRYEHPIAAVFFFRR